MLSEIAQKILNKEILTEEEVQEVILEGLLDVVVIEELFDELHRWSMPVTAIVRVKDRFFSLNYQRGLTEYQESGYEAQVAEEVEAHEVIKIEWRPKNEL